MILLLLVAGVILAALAGGYRERPALAAQQTPTPTPTPGPTPDYSKVDDFLNMRRRLLRTDDLVFNYVADNQLTTATAQTSNSAITKYTAATADTEFTGSYMGPRSARMFHLNQS